MNSLYKQGSNYQANALSILKLSESKLMAFDPRRELVIEQAPARPAYEGTGTNLEEPPRR